MAIPIISIIVAMDDKNGIGKTNELLWYISGDMKHFKGKTSGFPIIMGRKTYQSIGRALPNRKNIVITSDRNFQAEGCVITHSLDEALTEASKEENEEIFVIGGGQIYNLALPLTDKLYITKVEGDFGADTFFPDYRQFKNKISESPVFTEGNYKYNFLELSR